jgi:ferrous iron transport protein A
MNLTELLINKTALIIGFDEHQLPIKLLELGLVPNSYIKLIQKAPFGGPLLLELGKEKNRIAIRKEQAKLILIQI